MCPKAILPPFFLSAQAVQTDDVATSTDVDKYPSRTGYTRAYSYIYLIALDKRKSNISNNNNNNNRALFSLAHFVYLCHNP